MSKKLIECVPNISEGRDKNIIHQIASVVETVEGVKLLDIDPGKATNRTVITFVGEPEAVVEAAFRLVKKAGELIDMSKHKGEHPRFGATDVCPFVPVANITMKETVEYAHLLGNRIGKELGIPVYHYEFAAKEHKRKNLASCRAGEYEGLAKKLVDPEWKPDCGPAELNERVVKTGAVAVGARNFLIAYNVNLNTTSTRRANAIAFDIREKGRVKREGGTLTGKIITDNNGNPIFEPGMLKCVKGIGWYIEEYGVAQLSFNLTDISVTSVEQVFDAACERAAVRGLRVTGSELVGLIPLSALLNAGKHYLKKQQRSVGVSDDELIKIAVKSLGLDELAPFDPQKKVIEYVMADKKQQLINLSLKAFSHETASESPAPGGGSISAYMGAMGTALGIMVANLSAHKRGWDDRWEVYSDWAEKGKTIHDQLLQLVDEDTRSFNAIMEAFGLPKKTEQEVQKRKHAIQEATKYAIEVPFKVMELSFQALELLKTMAEIGNPGSVSDAGVGALAIRSAVMGAFLNVKINVVSVNDTVFATEMLTKGEAIQQKTQQLESEILEIVNQKLLE